MLRLRMTVIALAVLSAANAFSQAAPSRTPDGLELLKRAAQHYADAKSYRIEAIEERTFHNDFQRNWLKTVIVAAEAPGERYHYEAHSAMGTVLRVADGKTVWTYRPEQHLYTQKPVAGEASSPSKATAIPDVSLMRAENLRKELAGLAIHLKSAPRLPDAPLMINGREIPCYVVRIQTADLKRAQPGYSFEKMVWIDKARGAIVRISEHAHTEMISPLARFPVEEETSTTYPVVELDAPVPDDLLTFVPPSDAKGVQQFPNPLTSGTGPNLAGHQAPAIDLKSSDGTTVSLASYRGRPVLLDLWATWCPPCVEGLWHLEHIYAEAKDKGLAVISVDQDEEAKTATDFLAKNGYTWPNFHDDGQSLRALGPSPIPRTLLIDAQGKIVYDRVGGSEDEVRAAIAKLGSEYAFLAHPQQVPCGLSK